MRRIVAPLVCVALAVVAAGSPALARQEPPIPAGASAASLAVDPYEQHVWFNWDHADLDVLLLVAHDPLIGASFERAIAAWEAGIAHFSPDLAARHSIRAHWADDGAPPADFDPDIAVVPQGFLAITTTLSNRTCIATAPMAAGWGSFDRVTWHEFGHCLGLSHVFYQGEEYEPGFDIMGGGDGPKCPSNLNVWVLERVYSGLNGTVQVLPSEYRQSPTC